MFSLDCGSWATIQILAVAKTFIQTDDCGPAFVGYRRRSTPIRLSLRDAWVTVRYVGRSQRDERVRARKG